MLTKKPSRHVNLLHPHAHSWHRHDRTFGAYALRALRGITVTVAVLILFALPFAYSGQRAYREALRGKSALEASQERAEALDFSAARDRMDDAHASFVSAQDSVLRFAPFAPLPWIGPYISSTERLLATGVAATSAARGVLDVLASVTDAVQTGRTVAGELPGVLPDPKTVFRNLTREDKRAMLAAFASRRGEVDNALLDIDRAIEALDEVSIADLPPTFIVPLTTFRERLSDARALLAAVQPFTTLAPSVLGYPDVKRYLIFFQNNTELRPTGGFLGVYGIATVHDAELVSFVTDDVYALDGPSEKSPRPAPPGPIRTYLGIDKWYLRDANWSPDFPVAAAAIERLYGEEVKIATGVAAAPIDGIVAFTPQLAIDALRFTGPVTAGGKTFTPENVVDTLEFEVEKGFVAKGVAYHARKDIVGDLSHALIEKLLAMPVDRLVGMTTILKKNLAEGHVLFAMKDPELQALVEREDWAGRMRPVGVDYLSVIDANLASLKSDPSVARTLTYSIAPDKDGLVGSVRVHYDHRGGFDWKTTRYRTYARLYAPAGSTLIGVDGAMLDDKIKDPRRRPGVPDKGEELGRTWFGAFISIEPGEKKDLTFRFRLAPSVVAAIRSGSYGLYVEKQAGTLAHGLTLDLDFGKKLETSLPAEDHSGWGDTRYRFTTDLRIDRSFSVGF